jgi:hypothetical protein
MYCLVLQQLEGGLPGGRGSGAAVGTCHRQRCTPVVHIFQVTRRYCLRLNPWQRLPLVLGETR